MGIPIFEARLIDSIGFLRPALLDFILADEPGWKIKKPKPKKKHTLVGGHKIGKIFKVIHF